MSSYLKSFLSISLLLIASAQTIPKIPGIPGIPSGFLPDLGGAIDEVVIGYGQDGLMITENLEANLDYDFQKVQLDVADDNEWTVEFDVVGEGSFHLVDDQGQISIVGEDINIPVSDKISELTGVSQNVVGDLIGTLIKNALNAAENVAIDSSITSSDVLGDQTTIADQVASRVTKNN